MKKPNENIIKCLTKLASDPKNKLYVISELTTEYLDQWFSDIPNLNLVCENGYIYKAI